MKNVFVTLLLVTLLVSTSAAAPAPSAGTITQALTAPPYQLTLTEDGASSTPTETISLTLTAPPYQLTLAEDGVTTIQAEGYSATDAVGQALLPHRLVDVALPPDVDWDSLSLTVHDVRTTTVPGTHRLPVAVPDLSDTDTPLPSLVEDGEASIARIAAAGQMRKWHLARVDWCPFQYDASTGQLVVVEQAMVDLRFARTGEVPGTTLLADTALDDVAAERFVNYATAQIWYPQVDRSNVATYHYVIVTTNAIETNSTRLAAFVAHKQGRGYSVLVVTEDDYGGLAGQAPNGRAEKVRQWLKNNYAAYGIEYVLLVGNPTPGGTNTTAVPMKMCWPRSHQSTYQESPTDYFFADLTGDWDKDGDTVYGEYIGDWGVAGGVDLEPEVYVGRIPFYGSYTDLDSILQKTMDYETETSVSWRKSILLPMGFQQTGYDGAPLAQQMWDDYLLGGGYSRWRQYQQGSGPCGPDSVYPSNEELRGGTVVRDRWVANDYGIVAWWGHGSQTSASVGYDSCWDGTLFSSSYVGVLDDDHPAFTYQNSCTNGYPENSNNLGYAVLKRGGVTTVSASRVSWFNTGVGYGDFDGSTTNSGIGYEYVKRVVDELAAGEALYGAKSSMTPGSDTRLMNYYDFNLYGDPAVSVKSNTSIPVSEVSIVGATVLLANETKTYSAVVQPGNASQPITYTWDNGTFGTTANYSWTMTGTLTVAVTATNSYGSAQGSLPVYVLEKWSHVLYLPLGLRDF